MILVNRVVLRCFGRIGWRKDAKMAELSDEQYARRKGIWTARLPELLKAEKDADVHAALEYAQQHMGQGTGDDGDSGNTRDKDEHSPEPAKEPEPAKKPRRRRRHRKTEPASPPPVDDEQDNTHADESDTAASPEEPAGE